jgi:hypothetical protein
MNERRMASADTSQQQSAGGAPAAANPSAAAAERHAANDARKAKQAERVGVNSTSIRRR